MVAAYRRRWLVPILVVWVAFGTLSFAPGQRSTPAPLPQRLSDAAFWKLSTSLSEPDGSFRSENLVSNEHTYQYVVPTLRRTARKGGIYLGVAPDQNFTYILATEPRMAFIVDIRRGNLLQHLMYKALIELSADRAEFVARLFAKQRPAGLSPQATAGDLFAAFARVEMTPDLYRENYRRNVADIRQHLLKRHGFPLTPEDWIQLESIYFAFFYSGPSLRYSTTLPGTSRGNFGTTFPTFEDMAMQTDWEGRTWGYLASEDNFKLLKSYQERNLIVPVIGNFAGPKALRSVGKYIRDHGEVVSAFYVSNVEQYLFQDGLFDEFARNVASLPVDDGSVFIRSVMMRYGYRGGQLWSDGRGSALDPILPFVRDFQAGRIRSYQDVNVRSK